MSELWGTLFRSQQPAGEAAREPQRAEPEPRRAEPVEPRQPSPTRETDDDAVLDLETAGKTIGTAQTQPGFLRLAGYTDLDGDVTVTTDMARVLARLRSADRIVMHNGWQFDLPALVEHAEADWEELAAKTIDTLVLARLADPSAQKGSPNAYPNGYYGLDQVARRLGVVTKTDDLAAIAERHGGYEKIPTDDPEYVAYLAGDVAATDAVYHRLGTDAYAEREHAFLFARERMLRAGVAVDRPWLEKAAAEEADAKAAAEQQLATEHGVTATLANGKPSVNPLGTKAGKQALLEALRALGCEHYPRTKQGAPTFGKDGIAALRRVYGDKLGVTELLDLVATANGSIAKYAEVLKHTHYDEPSGTDRVYCSAKVDEAKGDQVSGRWAMSKPSLTNVGKRGGKHVQRRFVVPEPGHLLVSVDLDQVDMRAVAAHAQDSAYMALFGPGRDVHTEIAERVFGRTDADHRERAKTIGHGWNYGRGIRAISEGEGIPIEIVAQFDGEMRSQFPQVGVWQDRVRDQARAGRLLDNGFGRMLRADPDRAHTQAPALVGQSAARDLLAEGILALPDWVARMLRLVVHDEIVASVPIAQVEQVSRIMLDCLTFDWAPPWCDTPVRISAGLGKSSGHSWDECYMAGPVV